MALLLRKKGVQRVRPLEGGLGYWRRLGYPVSNVVAAPATGAKAGESPETTVEA